MNIYELPAQICILFGIIIGFLISGLMSLADEIAMEFRNRRQARRLAELEMRELRNQNPPDDE